MTFRNIHAGVRSAATDLFDSKPWSGTDEDKQTKFERFLRDASAAYGIPQPTLQVVEVAEGERAECGLVAPNTIVLDKYSVTSLFNAFRQHMQYSGAITVGFLNRRDAQAWACSLFYAVRPILFRKRVREGRISGVRETDLLTTASLAARQSEVDEAFAGIVSGSYDNDEDIEPEDSDVTDEQVDAAVGGILRATVGEAATALNVSESTIRNMINDGRLAAERNGRRITVLLDASAVQG
jgi:excisionase family DNA binding protein